MHAVPPSGSLTYPQGFLEFLTASPRHGYRIGDHELGAAGLERFNAALRSINPESPSLTLDQIAAAAQRALDRYPDGGQPAFVSSRLASLARLQAMVDDIGWDASDELRSGLRVLAEYIADPGGLIPDTLPVVGRLDQAVLIDIILQGVTDELADFEDFCRFRRIAADCTGIAVAETGLNRQQWLEALAHAHGGGDHGRRRPRRRYVADPRASLFHVL